MQQEAAAPEQEDRLKATEFMLPTAEAKAHHIKEATLECETELEAAKAAAMEPRALEIRMENLKTEHDLLH